MYAKIKSLSVLFCLIFLNGCDAVLLNPKGAIGVSEKQLIIDALLLMLIVVIPVIILTFVFAWKYRISNKNAKYMPNWSHSNKIELLIWSIPCIIIIILATITWKTTHQLDPYQPLNVAGEPLTIQVIALDWKWLFIYPQQNIATVNYIQFPVHTQIIFDITADAPMNSFMIPALGGQIYAMAGMKTKLHLIANQEGSYDGRSVSFSGEGFSGMTFVANASSLINFKQWVAKIKNSNQPLTVDIYNQLAQPSEKNSVVLYSEVVNHLFDNIIMKFMMPGMVDQNHKLMLM